MQLLGAEPFLQRLQLVQSDLLVAHGDVGGARAVLDDITARSLDAGYKAVALAAGTAPRFAPDLTRRPDLPASHTGRQRAAARVAAGQAVRRPRRIGHHRPETAPLDPGRTEADVDEFGGVDVVAGEIEMALGRLPDGVVAAALHQDPQRHAVGSDEHLEVGGAASPAAASR